MLGEKQKWEVIKKAASVANRVALETVDTVRWHAVLQTLKNNSHLIPNGISLHRFAAMVVQVAMGNVEF